MSCMIQAESGADRVHDDLSQATYNALVETSMYNYQTYAPAYFRKTTGKFAPTLGLSARPDQGPGAGTFYPHRVHQESFLQGRGHRTASNAACDVIYLPSDIFPDTNVQDQSPLLRNELDMETYRASRSANPVIEMDPSVYVMKIEERSLGYHGIGSLQTMDTKLLQPTPEQPNMGYRSYGTYPVQAAFAAPDPYQLKQSIIRY